MTCFSITPKTTFSIILSGTEMRLTGLRLPDTSFFSLKSGTIFASFQFSGTSPDSQDLWKMNRVRSHNDICQVCQYPRMDPTEPLDLCTSSCSRKPQTHSGWTEILSSPQQLWFSNRTPDFPGPITVEGRSEEDIKCAFSTWLFLGWQISWSHGPMLFLIPLLLWTYL